MHQKDYYQILGIERSASQDSIKNAYRKLARRFHPDLSKEKNAEERFKEIGEAYEILKDPKKRNAYDQSDQAWTAGESFRSGPGWNDGFGFTGNNTPQHSKKRFGDFFSSLFKGKNRSKTGKSDRQPIHGKDHYARVQIDLIDSYQGASRRISLQIPIQKRDGTIHTINRVLDVRIPKGIKAGQRIRLSGQGKPGNERNLAGDLYLEIDFKPHPLFTVRGADVFLDLPVAPWEAVLGALVKIPTPDGALELKIPPDSKQGSRIRLKGRGIPGSPNGHLYATLQIVLPPRDCEHAEKIYREMEKEFAFNPREIFGDLK